jgi:hypothetical protein
MGGRSMNPENVISTERLYDLSDINEVDDNEIRIILGKLLERLNLMPVRVRYMRKGIEMVAYTFSQTTNEEQGC